MAGEMVQIHYHRPPDRMDLFEQAIVEERDEYVVTFMPSAAARRAASVVPPTIAATSAPMKRLAKAETRAASPEVRKRRRPPWSGAVAKCRWRAR